MDTEKEEEIKVMKEDYKKKVNGKKKPEPKIEKVKMTPIDSFRLKPLATGDYNLQQWDGNHWQFVTEVSNVAGAEKAIRELNRDIIPL